MNFTSFNRFKISFQHIINILKYQYGKPFSLKVVFFRQLISFLAHFKNSIAHLAVGYDIRQDDCITSDIFDFKRKNLSFSSNRWIRNIKFGGFIYTDFKVLTFIVIAVLVVI